MDMVREEITKLELSSNELVDVALETDYAQDFDLTVDLHPSDVDDVAPPTVKLSDVERHASPLSSFLLENSLYFGVNEIIGLQKLIENVKKMTVGNLCKRHQKSLHSYFKSY